MRQEAAKLAIITGPAPAPLAKVSGFYRYHLLLRTRQIMRLTEILPTILREARLPQDVYAAVDVDPLSLL